MPSPSVSRVASPSTLSGMPSLSASRSALLPMPSPSLSVVSLPLVGKASLASGVPSLSESRSRWSGVPSPSVSTGARPAPAARPLPPTAGVPLPRMPSLSGSLPPASLTSNRPSPSLSRSRWSGVPSPSVSTGVRPAPLARPLASTIGVPLPRMPSLSASLPLASVMSNRPSLSLSRSRKSSAPSVSVSATV